MKKKQIYPGKSTQFLEEEIVADWLAKNTFTTQEAVNNLVDNNKTLGQKILEWTKSQIKKFSNTKDKNDNIKMLKKTEKMFYNAIQETNNYNKNIDNVNKKLYSEEKRRINYGDDFRRIQEESLRMSSEDIQGFHNGSKSIVSTKFYEVLARTFRRQIDTSRDSIRYVDKPIVNKNTNNEFIVHKNVNATLFHDVFEIVQKYLPNGDCVDIHEVESSEWSTGYEDCTCYLSDDGLSGFAITRNGDLISVFSLTKEGGFLKSIKDYVKNEGAKTLDCYQSNVQPLATIYTKTLGFKTASIMDFNYDILVEEKGKAYADYFVKTYGEAPVAFMINTTKNVETKHFNKDQYNEAIEYRDSFLENDNKRYSKEKSINEIKLEAELKQKKVYSFKEVDTMVNDFIN